MAEIARRTYVISGLTPDTIPYGELIEAGRPAILKGLARDWPLARAGLQSPQQAAAYLKSYYGGKPVVVFTGAPGINGRFFYNDDVSGLNFEAGRARLDETLDRILTHLEHRDAPSLYVGSTDVDVYLPGLRTGNDLVLNHPMFESNPPLVGVWIGNRTIVSAHYDMSNNIACSLVGQRRFTLFPPEQAPNLYPGPLDPTPAGQVVSMVDFANPDFDRHPNFRDALATAEVADLDPGDVLFYPALWWHRVEALESFNVMINYWWNTSPAFMDTPQNTLLHALLSLRDRPASEKRAWKALFDYYVFGPADRAGAHLPENARGDLGPMDDLKARRLRARLLNKLNR